MQLITSNHSDVINGLIRKSNKIILCSGWIKQPGIQKIYKSLEKASEAGATIIIYSNSKHTTKAAEKLIFKCKNIEYIIVNNKKNLHSKIYYFEHNETFSAIIGSANLTGGGLSKNEELSVLITGNKNSDIHISITSYLNTLKELATTKTSA